MFIRRLQIKEIWAVVIKFAKKLTYIVTQQYLSRKLFVIML